MKRSNLLALAIVLSAAGFVAATHTVSRNASQTGPLRLEITIRKDRANQ